MLCHVHGLPPALSPFFFDRKDQLTGRWESVITLLVKRKVALQALLQEWQDFCALRDDWKERVRLVAGRLAPRVWDATVGPAHAVEKQLQVVEVRHFPGNLFGLIMIGVNSSSI